MMAAVTEYRLPDAALAQHIAILGKTGAGKTTTEKVCVEQVVASGHRVCILDTVKSDWWGITSSADGKHAGLPFKILGGPRGHVPLHASAGKAIGQLVAAGKLPLSIVDMADFEPGGVQRFFIDFAEALMRHMRGVLYLVIEEAHEVAPKERSGIGAENLSIHWAKKLATAGRSKGIRLIVATQRIQALHNAVLGSCDTLITHRLTAPADQAPIVKWLMANVDKETEKAVEASLSSLPTGTGWICSGEAKVFEKVAFPKFKTYDNSATPTGDEEDDEHRIKTAPVDHDELRAIIGTAVQEAEANDPATLKKEIVELRAELAKKLKAVDQAEAAGDPMALPAVQGALKEAWSDGRATGRGEMVEDVNRRAAAFSTDLESILRRVGEEIAIVAELAIVGARADAATIEPDLSRFGQKINAPDQGGRVSAPSTKSRPLPPASPRPASPQSRTNSKSSSLSGPQANIMTALAWWRAMGHDNPTRTQLAAKAGLVPSGSTLRARLSELHSAGLIEYPNTGLVSLTAAGIDAAPAPDTADTLVDSIERILSGPQMQLWNALWDVSGAISREDLARAVGWEPGGSTLRARLSELHSLELVDYPSRGIVKLQDWVME